MDIIQGTVRLKRKRKWKTRWAVLRRVNPAADVINLIFYKDQVAAQARQKEKLFVSLAEYCGLQSLDKLEKVMTVIVIMTVGETVSFGFTSIEDRADWLHALQNHFGEERAFDGVIPNRQKFKPVDATLRVYQTHFSITQRDNFNCIGRWKYEDVPYYGAVEGGFAFKAVTSGNQEEDQHDLHFMSTRRGREINQVFDTVCHQGRHGSLHRVTYCDNNSDTMERRKTEGQPNFLKRAFLRLSRRGNRKRTRSEGAVLEKYNKRDRNHPSNAPRTRAAYSEADSVDSGTMQRPLPTPPGAVNKNHAIAGERFRFDSASIEAYSGPKKPAHGASQGESSRSVQTKDPLGYERVDQPKGDAGYEIVNSPEELQQKISSNISPRIENVKSGVKPKAGLVNIAKQGVKNSKDTARGATKESKSTSKETTIPVIEIQNGDEEGNESGKTTDTYVEKDSVDSKIVDGISASGRDSGIEKDVENGQNDIVKATKDVEQKEKETVKESEQKGTENVKEENENCKSEEDFKEAVSSPNDSVINDPESEHEEATQSITGPIVKLSDLHPVTDGFVYEPMGPADEGSSTQENKPESEEKKRKESADDKDKIKTPESGGSILVRRTSNNKAPFQQLTVSITKEDKKVKPRPPTPPQSPCSDYVNLRASEVINNVSPEVHSAEAVPKSTPVLPQKKSKTPWSKYDGTDDSVYHSVESLMPDGRRVAHGYQNLKYSANGRAHSFESLDGVHSYTNMPAPQYQNLGPGGSYINVPSKKKRNLNYIQVGVADLGPPTPRSQAAMGAEYTFIDEVKTNVLKKAAREHSFSRKENLARITKK